MLYLLHYARRHRSFATDRYASFIIIHLLSQILVNLGSPLQHFLAICSAIEIDNLAVELLVIYQSGAKLHVTLNFCIHSSTALNVPRIPVAASELENVRALYKRPQFPKFSCYSPASEDPN